MRTCAAWSSGLALQSSNLDSHGTFQAHERSCNLFTSPQGMRQLPSLRAPFAYQRWHVVRALTCQTEAHQRTTYGVLRLPAGWPRYDTVSIERMVTSLEDRLSVSNVCEMTEV